MTEKTRDLPALLQRGIALFEASARPLGIVLTLLLVAAVAVQAAHAPLSGLGGQWLQSWQFWALFAAAYLFSPCCEWLIYNRLWGFDWSALPALLRKLVSNEVLIGYAGDLQFLLWAQNRHRTRLPAFEAFKDVTVLSALTGNLVTTVQLLFAWPIVASGALGMPLKTAFLSLGIVLGTSLAIMALRKRIFSLPRRTLLWIGAVLVARTVLGLVLAALIWHLVLPAVSTVTWFVLATLRMLVSRLPLVPNKELLFAGLVMLLLGGNAQVSGLMAMMAALTLLAHLAVGGVLGGAALVRLAVTRNIPG